MKMDDEEEEFFCMFKGLFSFAVLLAISAATRPHAEMVDEQADESREAIDDVTIEGDTGDIVNEMAAYRMCAGTIRTENGKSLPVDCARIALGNINARDPDYWNVVDRPSYLYNNPKWMQRLPNNKNLAQLSIPGTHDTMARKGGLAFWTQSLSLSDQLQLGIRFLDIRCRHYQDGFYIHHGSVYQGVTFEEVLRTTIQFLDANPSETILMRIKQEYNPAKNTRGRSFTDQMRITLRKFPADRFWMTNYVPELGQCRGKIVILDNFAGGAMGIYWYSIDLEDHWSTSATNKWSYVRNHLDAAAQDITNPKLFLTFSSFTNNKSAPRELARSMNPKLRDYVLRKGWLVLG